MNFDSIPRDVWAHMQKTFADRGISMEDPIANIILAQVSMNELERKRRRSGMAGFVIMGIILAFSGYFFGRWSETQEVLKTRPMIDTVKNKWVHAQESFILVK